mmetsp:Transcript_21181/g.67670  ORF Transcript_21181/g.67670 Transcript_21181/m.67670 type:complete len:621 (+) Transcript_21181:55-1917(+)
MEIGSAYGRLWSIQQLCPFADAGLNALGLLGAAGAVDSRPILSDGDFYIRLPLCLLTFFYPTRTALLLAHVVNLVAFCAWTPFVWDHQYWGAATEATFVLLSMRSESDFVGAARAQTASLYLVAAFWKLTTSFLDYRTSCATVLVAEALVTLPKLLQAVASSAAETIFVAAPALTLVMEFAVGPLLVMSPRLGVLLGLSFHLVVATLPLNYACGFSVNCIVRYGVFMPHHVAAALREAASLRTWTAVHAAAIGIAVIGCRHLHGGIDTHFVACVWLAVVYVRSMRMTLGRERQGGGDAGSIWQQAWDMIDNAWVFCSRHIIVVSKDAMLSQDQRRRLKEIEAEEKAALQQVKAGFRARRVAMGASAPTWLVAAVTGLTLLWGVAPAVLGLQNMSALTMYGNVKHWGGSNHLLVPTGLLHRADGAAGGLGSRLSLALGNDTLVRVESTDSRLLASLSPADSTDQLPPRARRLMRAAGASGRYFGAYYSRMYHGEGRGVWPIGGNNESPAPYALTAYELSRLLAMAREHGEPFSVRLTLLPFRASAPSSPAQWRDFDGRQVIFSEEPGANRRSCATVDGSPCNAAEQTLADAPAPPRWLRRLLMQYPVPLLPDSEGEIHCSA